MKKTDKTLAIKSAKAGKIPFLTAQLFIITLTFQLNQNHCIAQGHDLIFSRVMLVNTTPQTVPTGYVWKINSFLPATDIVPVVSPGGSSNGKANVSFCMKLGTKTIYIGGNYGAWTYGSAMGYSGATGCSAVLDTQLWIPADSSIAAFTNVSAISVTEFKVQ